MAVYMKYDGIDGEVETEGYEKWIECNSFQMSINRNVTSGGTGKSHREASAPNVSDIFITRAMDSASLGLTKAALGIPEAKVKFDLTTTDNKGKHSCYARVSLEGVMVSNLSTSSHGGNDRPTESLALNFTKVEWKFVEVGGKMSGSSKGTLGWDIEKSKLT
jgi:type VI secretion system secreted protein Hcp